VIVGILSSFTHPDPSPEAVPLAAREEAA
jgi:hypothetical protein